MADSGAIRAGRAFIEVFADDSKLSRGMALISAKLKAFGAGVTSAGVKLAALGAAGTAPLIGAAYAYTEAGSALGKFSQRTGIAVEELSALEYAAKRSGLEAEQLEGGIKKMQKELFMAGGGSAEARKAIHDLGLSMDELKSLSPDQQILKMSDAFKALDDPTKKTGLALAVFGKSGTDMIPFLNKGSEGIHTLGEEGKRLGAVLGGEDVKAAKEFKAVMAQLKAAALGVTYSIGSAVIPGMTRLRNLIMPLVENVTRFARENKGLFDVLFDVATGITVAGLSLVVLGKTVSLVGSGVGVLWKTMQMGAGAAVLGFKVFAAAFYAALSPLGLAVIAVGGLVAAFLYLTDVGAKVRSQLTQGWTAVAASVTASWKGIVDAIKAGDLELAGKIAIAGLKVAWFTGMDAMRQAWRGLMDYIADTSNEQSGNLAKGILALSKTYNQVAFSMGRTIGGRVGAFATAMMLNATGGMTLQAGGIQDSDIDAQTKARADAMRLARAERDKKENPELGNAQAELDRLSKEAAAKRFQKEFGLRKRMIVDQEKAAGLGEVGAGVGTTSAAGFLAQSGGGLREELKKANEKHDKTNELLERMIARGQGGIRFT